MLSGTFTSGLLDTLDPYLVERYNLGELRVVSFTGVLRWIIRSASEWWLGDTVGATFADAVLAGWTNVYPSGVPADWYV